MFSKVLVANRGEIAVRVIRTLRELGIRSVLVTSIPDRHSLAARLADESFLLEGYSAPETYLDIPAVIAAARATACEAIHPGYGFLSERPDFAEACAAAGIVFVGPPPGVLRVVGDKSAARRLAIASNVPVVPGWNGDDDGPSLLAAADHIGYPVMLKARGGGGGRGMRVARSPEELREAIPSARREAEAAFGDPRLLLEKLVEAAHHVEVQVLADAHGNIVHLGERDCSVQRRHQKIVEETPSPVVDPPLRSAITAAALRLAREVGYVNAGTFEFLVGAPGEGGDRPFYFLEVNPRLQVEHPVTELVTGLDLVALQLRIAAGEPLPFAQDDVRFEGHAIEMRINAEDPWNGFAPSAGTLTWRRFGLPTAAARADLGYETGDAIPAHYDSLVGKLFGFGRERPAAIADALTALQIDIGGIQANLALHREVLWSDAFRAGEATIDWLEPHLEELLEKAIPPAPAWAAAALGAATLSGDSAGHSRFSAGARWLGAGASALWLAESGRVKRVGLGTDRETIHVDDDTLSPDRVIGTPGGLEVEAAGLSLSVARSPSIPGGYLVTSDTTAWLFRVVPPPPLPRRAAEVAEGITAVVAPLAGTIVSVLVHEGDTVDAGQLLLVLEAMKMEHRVTATTAGTVAAVAVSERDVVAQGDILLEVR